jgi:ribosomal protein S12 methylthiotransferase accessory factor
LIRAGFNIVALAEGLDGPVLKLFKHGTHRITSPDDTLAQIAPRASQFGITRFGNVTGLDRIGIPVTVAVRPNSRSVSVSQGKGLGLSQAFASALMEAIELFHAEEPVGRVVDASFPELSANGRAVRPGLLTSGETSSPDQSSMRWLEGYDLLARETCWVPWGVVHTDYTLRTRHDIEQHRFLSGSNGLASGNHLVEAASSAICELVERDAVAVWHARSIRERADCHLAAGSIDDGDCRTILQLYEAAQIRPRIWDVTSDIGIPAFVCDIPAAARDADNELRRFRGSGCHPDRGVALARALTEAAQVRLTYIAGIRDDLPGSDYAESAEQKLGAALLDAVSQVSKGRLFCDVPSHNAEDVAIDLRWELERLRAIGIQRVVAVNLTRPEFGIPVVKVVIPGLEWDLNHPYYAAGLRARKASGRSE